MAERFTDRASGATQQHAYRRGPRIVALETVVAHEVMRGLLAVRVHTDTAAAGGESLVGNGETYYIPEAAAAVIHDWMSHRLLGADALAVESHWRFLYDRLSAFGGMGAELRALSAVELALWDIRGQMAGLPVWRLLGGPVCDSVRVYNSCGGPFYGRRPHEGPATAGWPGHGDPGRPGPLEDNWRSIHEPAALAEELLGAGYRAMKLWSFDAVYRRTGGLVLSPDDVDEGLAPFRAIRERVGDRIELILDGHGFFTLPAAMRIADAIRPLRPLWLEDVLRPDCLETLAEFRRSAGVPVAVSEMLTTRDQYRRALELSAADFIMIDPTWVGGIGESRRIAELAQGRNVPVVMHDCTGPLTLLAGLHVAAAVPGVAWQETVRAHVQTLYPELIDGQIEIADGHVALPERPGLGARWREELFRGNAGNYRITRL